MRIYRHKHFFIQLQAHKQFFFSGNGFANNFFLRNAMLYYEESYVTTLLISVTTY